jgi:hypothetical protein
MAVSARLTVGQVTGIAIVFAVLAFVCLISSGGRPTTPGTPDDHADTAEN